MKHLVLAGGGHAHVEVLRRLAALRYPVGTVTVISPEAHSPYSGMLPGLIAGHYTWAEGHITLTDLCQHVGAELVLAAVTAVDPEKKVVLIDDGRTVEWDLLSLNTGSTPDLDAVPGARAHAVPVKPVSGFLRAWEAFSRTNADNRCIAVVGGGAAGVEVALAMRYRLSRSPRSRRNPVTLITRELLPTHSRGVRRRVERVLHAAGIELLCDRKLAEVRADVVRFADGEELPTNLTVWATGASAPSWLARAALATDPRGFLLVDATLRSISHPTVLAAGDIASLSPQPVPKAGVFAVRQGRVLAENLLRLLRDEAPLRYSPQRRFLSLISLGERRAVASWGPWSTEGAWVWRLKNRIDRKFMSRYAGGNGSGQSLGPTQAPQVFS